MLKFLVFCISWYFVNVEGGFLMEVVGSQAFDDLIRKMRSGRITRRTFLEQTLVLGLTSSQDQDVLAKNPFFKHLGPVLQTALPRPTSPRYIDLSTPIHSLVHSPLPNHI